MSEADSAKWFFDNPDSDWDTGKDKIKTSNFGTDLDNGKLKTSKSETNFDMSLDMESDTNKP